MTIARRRLIAALAFEGQSAAEIAESLGISKARVCRIASKAGLIIGAPGGNARVGAYIPRRLKAVIGEVAEEAGVSQSRIIARLCKVYAADAPTLRHALGKGAMPVRAYRAAQAVGG